MQRGSKEVIRRWPIALLMVCSIATLARAEEVSPDVLVRKTTEEVLKVVRSDKDIKGGNVARIVQLIEEKVAPHFNFERMTRLAVGRPWRRAFGLRQSGINGKRQLPFQNQIALTRARRA